VLIETFRLYAANVRRLLRHPECSNAAGGAIERQERATDQQPLDWRPS